MAATADSPATAIDQNRRTRSRIVADHYEIDPEHPIGTGGMSIVYAGRDLKNRRDVAMRTLRPEHATDPEVRARFRKEARRMAFIQHPNVARVYDLWEDDLTAWVAMELVPGESLRDRIGRTGPLTVADVEPIVTQVASALDALHDADMVHLDVKPSNLIQTPEGTIKLIDFGLAQEPDRPQELLNGQAYGSAAYLSPEQAAGEAVRPASDVYAFGCVIYELLTGRTPFEDPYRSRSPQEMIQAHLRLQPERPSEANREAHIPDWSDELIIWTLLKDPDARPSTPGQVAELYERGVAGLLTAADIRRMRATATPVPRPEPSRTATVPAAAPIEVQPAPIATPVAAPISPPIASRKKPLLVRAFEPVRPLIWRLVVAFLVVDAILATVLYVQRGEIPGIVGRDVSALAPGTSAVVAVDGLNLRTDAGMTAPSIGTLAAGSPVYLAGQPLTVDGERWWPVTIGDPNDGLDGYVWENGLVRPETTLRDRIDLGISDAFDRIRERVGV